MVREAYRVIRPPNWHCLERMLSMDWKTKMLDQFVGGATVCLHAPPLRTMQ